MAQDPLQRVWRAIDILQSSDERFEGAVLELADLVGLDLGGELPTPDSRPFWRRLEAGLEARRRELRDLGDSAGVDQARDDEWNAIEELSTLVSVSRSVDEGLGRLSSGSRSLQLLAEMRGDRPLAGIRVPAGSEEARAFEQLQAIGAAVSVPGPGAPGFILTARGQLMKQSLPL